MSTFALYSRRVRRSLEGCRFRMRFGLALFEEGYCLDLFGFLIALPFLDRWAYEPHEMIEKWGVYLERGAERWPFFESIVFCWGSEVKFVHMPWEWTHYSWYVCRPDGTWVVKDRNHYDSSAEPAPDGRELLTLPYRYVLCSGTVQERIARVYVDRGEWRRKWSRWCPLFAKKKTCINVTFNDEVGERTGSWKGGTIGCAYALRRGETAAQCLRRMERERTFR